MAFLIVAYDVPSDSRRTRLHKQLKNFGEPVQYSVFEFDLTPKQRASMLKIIQSNIKKEEDRVRVYELCGACRVKTVVFGEGQLQQNQDTLFV